MRSIVPRLTRAALHSSIRARPASLAALRASSYHGLRIRSYSGKASANEPATEHPVNTFEDEPERKWSTPLAKQLADAIGATGPVPLASYMRMCLTSDTGGYYTGAIEDGRDQFGLKGDFVTSPEISQVFGELIGIWFLTEWLAQGEPKKGVELIEVGPGRGTLMDDMLRTINQFPAMANGIDAIYMVEASPKLRLAQKDLLCGKDAPMTESKVGYHSVCKSTQLPIVWTETIKFIPSAADKTPFIVAHEFFDALPIHAFQCVSVLPAEPPSSASPSTKTTLPTLQWREMLVSPTPEGSTHESLHTPPSQSRSGPPPDFQMTLANSSTRHSRYLPETSPRYRTIKSKDGAGAVIEVCPDANLYASDFASRIGGSAAHPKSRPSGAALILDYGPGDGSVPINSLRGIKAHKRVSPFAEPGLVDLSVDVDFTGIAESAMNASEGVEVHGPVEQGMFLEGMGIRERVEVLTKGCKDEESRKAVETAWRRLVDRGPGGMGKVYKALAILPENEGRRRPVGFGGDVQG